MSGFVRVIAAACSCAVCLSTALARNVDYNNKAYTPPTAAAIRFDRGACLPIHNTGKLVLHAGWDAGIGGGYHPSDLRGCFTGGEFSHYSEYPKGSGVIYLMYTDVNVGGIIRFDTLVSTVGEFTRAQYYDYLSTTDPSSPVYEGAVAQQEYITSVVDTFTDGFERDFLDPRFHKPLFLELTSHSYSWSYEYADDFVLYQLDVHNIGRNTIQDAYVMIEAYPAVTFTPTNRIPQGHLIGFRQTERSPGTCESVDTLNLMWWADNDGDPVNGAFTENVALDSAGDRVRSCPDVAAIHIIAPPSVAGKQEWRQATLSFNWHFPTFLGSPYDFGPRRHKNYRDFGTGGTGWPYGDRNMYYMISSGEIDYDQAFTAIFGPLNAEWLPPPAGLAPEIADGSANHGMLSIGPFDIGPGATLPIVYAFVAGENFHTDPHAVHNLPWDPWAYYDNLDFSDLAKNAIWAEWIYDNPGVDTDGDGDSGEYRVCASESTLVDSAWVYTRAESTWYKGDGVPDWKAAGPPPAPVFWLEPLVTGLRIRFNGQYSETTPDIFLRIVDFEGYRVYLGRDERVTSYSLVASYDRDDYDKYVWNRNSVPDPQWELYDFPFFLDSLRCLYGSGTNPCLDSAFDPLLYTPSEPYFHPAYPESAFYFVKHDFNTSELGVSTPIRKVYPDEPDPRLLPIDSLTPERYTTEGYFKYFEYDLVVDNLLTTVPYWVNVTAFNFGAPKSKLWALETSKTAGASYAFPTHPSADSVYHGKVFIYPN
ncbi:MAG TPA: hypothetical protein VN285_03225, partial [Candidatus Deferrimicrobium sp.]|nr:hypothetical protein [Candidatus Deferrimicrobium sp.]